MSKETLRELWELDDIRDRDNKRMYVEIMNKAHLKLMEKYYKPDQLNDHVLKQINAIKDSYTKEAEELKRFNFKEKIDDNAYFLRNFQSFEERNIDDNKNHTNPLLVKPEEDD